MCPTGLPRYIGSQSAFPSPFLEFLGIDSLLIGSSWAAHFSLSIVCTFLLLWFAQAYHSTRHALGSIPVKILPIAENLHFVPLISTFIFPLPISSFRHLSTFYLTCSQPSGMHEQTSKQTNFNSGISPTEPRIAFHSARNRQCTACKH